jgi:hypothetical protein
MIRKTKIKTYRGLTGVKTGRGRDGEYRNLIFTVFRQRSVRLAAAIDKVFGFAIIKLVNPTCDAIFASQGFYCGKSFLDYRWE